MSLGPSRKKLLSTLSRLSASQTVPRRSQRSRRPSLHKLESDEYQASSQGSSRPPSPSEPKPKGNLEPDPDGKRGKRPGRIVQPDNAWTPQHGSLPEPFTEPGSPAGCSSMADERAARKEDLEVEVISKAEGIRRVSAHLGYDVSRMSEHVLKEILEDLWSAAQADPSNPLEIEGGTAPALMQSANRMVLGGGPQPLAGGAPDVIDAPQESDAQLAYPDAPLPLGQSASQAPPNDSATEPESDTEMVELGPEDSVSQHVPPAFRPVPSAQLPTHPIPSQDDHTPRPIHNAKRNSDTATIDESDDDVEIIRFTKRQRLAAPPHQTARSPPVAASCTTHTSASAPRPSSSTQRILSRTVAPGGHIIISAAPKSPSALSSTLLHPPPMSDVDAVLVWASRLATNVASSRPAANQGPCTSRDDPYYLLASVLGDLRSHLATTAPKSTTTRKSTTVPKLQADMGQRLRRPRDTDFVEDNADILEAEAALVLGKWIGPARKPCLSDFPGFRRHIASGAIPDLIATLITEGAYEVYGAACQWAEESYNRQWDAELPDQPLQEAPRPLKSAMVHRGSCFRYDTLVKLRPEASHLWPFIRTPRTPDDLQYNIRLAKRLLPNQFHCADPKTGTDPYEHASLQVCIGAGLFWGLESTGVIFEDRYRPLSLPAVAFILTTMQHCIEEWQTGRWVKIKLSVNEQRKSYESHLLGLLEYDKKAHMRLCGFQEAWFKYGILHAGATYKPEQAPYQPITQADQIREDTPNDDTAPEARPVKGKHRVMN